MHFLILLGQIIAMEPTLQLLDPPLDLRTQPFIKLEASALSLSTFNSINSAISNAEPNFFATKVMPTHEPYFPFFYSSCGHVYGFTLFTLNN